MGIVTNAEGFMFHDGLASDCIVVEENRIDEYVSFINKNGVKYLTVNQFYYKQREIGFLERCPHVEKVNVNTDLIKDFSGLYHLSNLKMLYVNEPDGELDLSRLDKLEELAMDWNKNVKGLNTCKSVSNLRLWHYRPKSNNLEELSSLSNIKELVLTQTSIPSLKGCRAFHQLEKLELNYMSKLEVLDEIEHNSSTLKSLRFDVCKKIKNHDYVTSLKELELLAFNNCGDIPSIGFIRKLPKLKSFIFVGTNIVDGDLSPCVGLEYVGFIDKRHYSHKFKELMPNWHWRV